VQRAGRDADAYLLRLTASACITPNVTSRESANYDATCATGLVSAVRKTLDCDLEVYSVWGCNRQMSRFGQTNWVSLGSGEGGMVSTHRPPALERGIVVQIGAGGGGPIAESRVMRRYVSVAPNFLCIKSYRGHVSEPQVPRVWSTNR
jgi:hypothetical protein